MLGFVRTEMTSKVMEPKHEQIIPLKRIASPQEIAEAVYFMANASYIQYYWRSCCGCCG